MKKLVMIVLLFLSMVQASYVLDYLCNGGGR